jgi:hypothetical protein
MDNYPYTVPAEQLEPGQIVQLKDTRHVVESVASGHEFVRVELKSGLRAVLPIGHFVTVLGVHAEPEPDAPPVDTPPAKRKESKAVSPKSADRTRMSTGDIVQITNPEKAYYPGLAIVQNVYSWGIKGYALIPALSGRMVPMMVTLNKGDYDWVGVAVIVSSD